MNPIGLAANANVPQPVSSAREGGSAATSGRDFTTALDEQVARKETGARHASGDEIEHKQDKYGHDRRRMLLPARTTVGTSAEREHVTNVDAGGGDKRKKRTTADPGSIGGPGLENGIMPPSFGPIGGTTSEARRLEVALSTTPGDAPIEAKHVSAADNLAKKIGLESALAPLGRRIGVGRPGEVTANAAPTVTHQATYFAPSRRVDEQQKLDTLTDQSGPPPARVFATITPNGNEWSKGATENHIKSASSSHAAPATERPSTDCAAAQFVAHQIADFISEDVASEAQPASQLPTQPASQPTVSSSPIRTLSLQLSPDSLGSVNIELSHSDGVLKIRIDLERAASAEVVEEGRGEISERLASAGYRVEELIVGRLGGGQEPNGPSTDRQDGHLQSGTGSAMDQSRGGARDPSDRASDSNRQFASAGANQQKINIEDGVNIPQASFRLSGTRGFRAL
jgi:Flagellar hook-length control protein FliK